MSILPLLRMGCPLGAGSLRRRMRSHRQGPTGGSLQEPRGRDGHDLHGRADGHLEDDLRRAGTRAEVRPASREPHRRPTSEERNVRIEIRWGPSHQGIEGNEIADEWAKLAADEPDAHGVEWLLAMNPDGAKVPAPTIAGQRQARPLRAEVGRLQELGKKEAREDEQPQVPPRRKQKPDPTVARANNHLAARFYQLKTGHCLTGQYLAWTTRRPDASCWWCQYSIQTREHLSKKWKSQQKTLWTTVLEETKKLPGPTRGRVRTNIAELLADERCSQAVLVFLATADVGRTSGTPVAADGDGEAREASE